MGQKFRQKHSIGKVKISIRDDTKIMEGKFGAEGPCTKVFHRYRVAILGGNIDS